MPVLVVGSGNTSLGRLDRGLNILRKGSPIDVSVYIDADRILRAVGAAIKAVVGDRGYRYGGDEFAVLIVGRARNAEEVTAQLNSAIAGVSRRGREIRATAGWAINPHDADTSDGLLVAADMALYRAKRRTVRGQPPLRLMKSNVADTGRQPAR